MCYFMPSATAASCRRCSTFARCVLRAARVCFAYDQDYCDGLSSLSVRFRVRIVHWEPV